MADALALVALGWCAGLGAGVLLVVPALSRALRERDEARDRPLPAPRVLRIVQLREPRSATEAPHAAS